MSLDRAEVGDSTPHCTTTVYEGSFSSVQSCASPFWASVVSEMHDGLANPLPWRAFEFLHKLIPEPVLLTVEWPDLPEFLLEFHGCPRSMTPETAVASHSAPLL
jgi:hypothetical protein